MLFYRNQTYTLIDICNLNEKTYQNIVSLINTRNNLFLSLVDNNFNTYNTHKNYINIALYSDAVNTYNELYLKESLRLNEVLLPIEKIHYKLLNEL